MEKEYRHFLFLVQHHAKVELYCFIYIIIFGKHLSELYWIVLIFLDPQCIATQEDFQHKNLYWSTLPLLLSCPYMQVGQERGSRNYLN